PSFPQDSVRGFGKVLGRIFSIGARGSLSDVNLHWEVIPVSVTRRLVATGLAAAPVVLKFSRARAAATTLTISHQSPGGTIEQGDFRDRLCRIFAKKAEEATKGGIKFEIYANSSLMKTIAQFSALRKGALDMSFYPLAYAGGEIHETNIG